MFEIAGRLLEAFDAGRRIAVATAVSIEGSAPRTVGTSIGFDGSAVIGSIAGGCVEGAVVEVCEEVLADGVTREVEYGVSDETAFSVGLTCGGQLRIVVCLLTRELAEALRASIDGGAAGFFLAINADAARRHEGRLVAELGSRLALGSTGLSAIDCDGETVEVFFEVSLPSPWLIIFGAMEFSVALSNAAQVLGYRVTVVDPRPLFATAARFPGAEVVVSWPTVWLESAPTDERTVICVLSHDARFDAELIAIALGVPAAFVGAMGSRRTHDRRVASLRERGVSPDAILRLRSPIGLDLGASTVEETAVAILAEVIAARTGAATASLTATHGPIHARRTAWRPTQDEATV